jgi:predicted CXXCH cytochrome family protein
MPAPHDDSPAPPVPGARARRALGWLPAGLALVPVALFALAVQQRSRRELLLPGPTSSGHHQIEGQCETCHAPFGGAREQACLDCHGAALAAQNDSHAAGKFADPGRAGMLAHVDARSCVACHREHRPEARQRGSVSVAGAFCFPCHTEVRAQRPSHRDFTPGSCADAGCHNYHDNRSLYEDLLVKRRDEPRLKAPGWLPLLTATAGSAAASGAAPGRPLRAADADLPGAPAAAVADWAGSAHAAAGVNCSGCHGRAGAGGAAAGAPRWRVPVATCGQCHDQERAGFLAGKHGMRLALELAPMRPDHARQPMRPEAHGRELGCNSCHAAHGYDLARAAVEACEGCHADTHTRAYRASRHFTLWRAEQEGRGAPGSGVSCASCHLPRRAVTAAGAGKRPLVVVHNQNDSLRPPDRMAREVCGHCHGLGFSLQALADPGAGKWNYSGPPGPVTTAMDVMKGARKK